MAKKWVPPEKLIAELLFNRTPRELAIGYLRATRRARMAEHAFELSDKLGKAREAVKGNDTKKAADFLDQMIRGLKS